MYTINLTVWSIDAFMTRDSNRRRKCAFIQLQKGPSETEET